MSELLLKQFEVARGNFIKSIEKIPNEALDVQLEGLNNTIHWHIGHVLTVAEMMLFGFPKRSTYLPENYVQLFGNGTKPADWPGEVPSVETLIGQIKEQASRIQEIPVDSFTEKLPKPFLGSETFGELAFFAISHELHHLGQIHTSKLLILNK